MDNKDYKSMSILLDANFESSCAQLVVNRYETRDYIRRELGSQSNEEKRKNFSLIREYNIMTPEELKFKEFFDHEKVFVKDMDDFQLEAHRAELMAIAFEARCRVGAVDRVREERKPRIKAGFRPITADEAGSEAINNIKKRQDQLTKEEKKYQIALQSLINLGMTEESARKTLSAGAMAAKLKKPGESVTKENASSFLPTFTSAATAVASENEQPAEHVNDNGSSSSNGLAEQAKPTMATKSFNPFKR